MSNPEKFIAVGKFSGDKYECWLQVVPEEILPGVRWETLSPRFKTWKGGYTEIKAGEQLYFVHAKGHPEYVVVMSPDEFWKYHYVEESTPQKDKVCKTVQKPSKFAEGYRFECQLCEGVVFFTEEEIRTKLKNQSGKTWTATSCPCCNFTREHYPIFFHEVGPGCP